MLAVVVVGGAGAGAGAGAGGGGAGGLVAAGGGVVGIALVAAAAFACLLFLVLRTQLCGCLVTTHQEDTGTVFGISCRSSSRVRLSPAWSMQRPKMLLLLLLLLLYITVSWLLLCC